MQALLHDTESETVSVILDLFKGGKKKAALDEDGNVRLDLVFGGWRRVTRENKPLRDESRLRSRCVDAALTPPAERTPDDVAALMAVATRAPGLRNVNRDVLAELCRCAFKLELLDDHEQLFSAGEQEAEPHMYVVIYGRVSTWDCALGGADLKRGNLKGQRRCGDSIGEEWVLGEQRRPISAVVEEPSLVLSVSRSAYFAVEQARFQYLQILLF